MAEGSDLYGGIDVVQEAKRAYICSPCRKDDSFVSASCFCEQCSELFCDPCVKYHNMLEPMKAHTLLNMAEMKEKNVDFSQTIQHGSEDISVCVICLEKDETNDAVKYCVDCHVAMCAVCTKHHNRFAFNHDHQLVDQGQETGAIAKGNVVKDSTSDTSMNLCNAYVKQHKTVAPQKFKEMKNEPKTRFSEGKSREVVLEHEITTLKGHLEEKQSEYQELVRNSNAVIASMAQQAAKNEKLKLKIEKLKDIINQQQNEIEEINARYNEAVGEFKNLEEIYQRSKVEHQVFREQIDQNQHDNDDLQKVVKQQDLALKEAEKNCEKYASKCESMQKTIDKQQENFDDAIKLARCQNDEITKEKEILKHDISAKQVELESFKQAYKDTTETMQNSLDQQHREIVQLKSGNEYLARTKGILQEKLSEKELKLNQANENVQQQTQELELSNKKIDSLQKSKDQLQKEITLAKMKRRQDLVTLEQLKESRKHEHTLQLEVEACNKKLVDMEKELKEIETSSLRKLTGNKQSDNNPNITDSSDKYSPSKLGEKFQALHDNQWTDAFKVAEKCYKTETECVGVLLKILLATKTFCEEESKRQEQTIKNSLSDSSRSKQFPDVADKLFKVLKKAMATKNVDSVYQKFIDDTPTSSIRGKLTHCIKDYVRECVTICWFMTLQDPPVVFGPYVKSREKFDTSVYRPYMNSGELIDFVVWPPVYLHEGGPLLDKGVAQGYKVIRPQSERQSLQQPALTLSNRDPQDDSSRNVNIGENAGSAASPSDRRQVASTSATTLKPQHEPRKNSSTDNTQTTVTAETATPCTGPATANYRKYRQPPKNDLDKYQYYLSNYGEALARRIMGDQFEICHNDLKAKREYY